MQPSSISPAEAEQTIVPVSVIMPSCNPPLETIQAALEALQAQTLPLDQWELIIVDNNSRVPLDTLLDLSWHPGSRIVHESVPGLLPARSRGMRESRGEVVISVDDDNILDPDYLAVVLRMARERPDLGVWGGSIQPDFDGPPPPWIEEFDYHLAVREVSRPSWSSFVDDRSNPYGASMCIRRPVVDAYLRRLDTEKLMRYGRNDRGANTSFVGGEDLLIGHTASLLGYSIGRFPELRLRHRVSSKRFDPEYFVKMARGNAHGALLVEVYHRNVAQLRSPLRTVLIWPVLKYLKALLFSRGMSRRVKCAEARGEIDALLEVRREKAHDFAGPSAEQLATRDHIARAHQS